MFKTIVICKDKNSLNKIENTKLQNVDFCIIDETKDLNKYDLCILEADFTQGNYFNTVKKLINNNTTTLFWGGNFCCTRNDIIKSYSIGCKNFIQFPITQDIISKFVNNSLKNNSSKNDLSEYKENFENMKVLVVDDTEINLELLKEVLSIFHLQTYAFYDPEEAYEFAAKEKIDLILLDIMMPVMNGFEFAQNLKTTKNKNTPVIFISALADNNDKMKGYNLGSFAYIEKPFEVNTLRAQLFNILKIQKLQKQKEDFIAMLTHDLKTPIKAQIRALELLINKKFGKLSQLQKEILAEILASCKLLNYMTDDVLANYKFENGTIMIKKEPYSLKKLIEEKIHSFRYLLEQKKQTVRYSYNSEIETIEIDTIELGRVLNNLIINASEYSAEGCDIFINVTQNDNFLEVSIKNKGKDFTKNEVNSVFEKYYSKAKQYNKIGAGLGLYISKKILELHGGTIKIDLDKDPNYTEFIFALPYKKQIFQHSKPTLK